MTALYEMSWFQWIGLATLLVGILQAINVITRDGFLADVWLIFVGGTIFALDTIRCRREFKELP